MIQSRYRRAASEPSVTSKTGLCDSLRAVSAHAQAQMFHVKPPVCASVSTRHAMFHVKHPLVVVALQSRLARQRLEQTARLDAADATPRIAAGAGLRQRPLTEPPDDAPVHVTPGDAAPRTARRPAERCSEVRQAPAFDGTFWSLSPSDSASVRCESALRRPRAWRSTGSSGRRCRRSRRAAVVSHARKLKYRIAIMVNHGTVANADHVQQSAARGLRLDA